MKFPLPGFKLGCLVAASATGLTLLTTLSLQPASSAAPRVETAVSFSDEYMIPASPVVLAAIESYISSRPGSFAGVWLDQTRRTVYVAVTPGVPDDISNSVVGAARAAAGHAGRGAVAGAEWSLRFTAARYSLTDLQRVMNSITTARPWAALAGPYLAAWYVSSQADGVIVGLTHVTAALRRAARQAFGATVSVIPMQRPVTDDDQTVISGQPRIVYITRRPNVRHSAGVVCSRLLDCGGVGGYFGGDRIIWQKGVPGGTEIFQCTLGFAWSTPMGPKPPTRNSSRVAVTAGHCAPPSGTLWYQGYYSSSNRTIYATVILGRRATVSFGQNRPDAETIYTQSSNVFLADFIYTRPNTSYPFFDTLPTGYRQVTEGEKICADGSFTGENCHGVVRSVNGCANVNDPELHKVFRICGLAYATAASRLVQQGDSGGPVYHYTVPPTAKNGGGEISLAGTITAGNSKVSIRKWCERAC
jgi:hypothetical protein